MSNPIEMNIFDNQINSNTEDYIHFLQLFHTHSSLKDLLPEDEFVTSKEILNFGVFTRIVALDINVISKNLLQSKHSWEYVYNIKSMNVLIHEAIKSYNAINGKITSVLNDSEEFKKERKLFSSKLKDFNNKYFNTTKNIRHQIGAHININFEEYQKVLHQIVIPETFTKIHEFYLLIDEMKNICAFAVEIATKRITTLYPN